MQNGAPILQDIPLHLWSVDVCSQTDKYILKDGMRSFPSGHASSKEESKKNKGEGRGEGGERRKKRAVVVVVVAKRTMSLLFLWVCQSAAQCL